MKEQITQALGQLIGQPLWDVTRGAGIAMFQFGERRSLPDRSKKPRVVGAFALHIQCAWRIVGAAGIIVGWNDRYFAPGKDPFRDHETFDYEVPAITRFEERVAVYLIERVTLSPVVSAINADAAGSFRLMMSDETAVEVFPDLSFGEHWRLFEPGNPKRHFVVIADAIEE